MLTKKQLKKKMNRTRMNVFVLMQAKYFRTFNFK